MPNREVDGPMQRCRTDETKAALDVKLGTELTSVLCGDHWIWNWHS